MKKQQTKGINLDEVMISLSEQSKSEMSMKIGDHKFLCKLMDAHTKVIAEMTDEKLQVFAGDSWNELMDFIKNQYEGIGNQLQEQTGLIRETKGKMHDIERNLGILRQDFQKYAEKTDANCTKISEHDRRIGDLEREVKSIKKEIGMP